MRVKITTLCPPLAWAAKRELEKFVSDMSVLVSGSGQSLPVVPWIAILDPDVTTTAKKGLYLVYLYRCDLSHVYLSMNLGTTQHHEDAKGGVGSRANGRKRKPWRNSSSRLRLRERLNDATLDALLPEIDLAAPGYFLPSGYEVGNVAVISYDLTQLPDEETLQADLARMIALHDAYVGIKKRLAQAGSEKTKAKSKTVSMPPIFRPKSSAAYLAEVKALFSAPVGPAFVQLLASMAIESIWRDGDTWDGHAPDVTTSLLTFAQANM